MGWKPYNPQEREMAVLVNFPQRLSDGSTQTVYVNPAHVQKVTPSTDGEEESLIHFGRSDYIVICMSCDDVAHSLITEIS